ncbi:MAG: phosphotransferase [bacterium]
MIKESINNKLAIFSEENELEVETALLQLRPKLREVWQNKYDQALEEENQAKLHAILNDLKRVIEFQQEGLQDKLTEDDFIATFSETKELDHDFLVDILADLKAAYFNNELTEIDSGMAGSVYFRKVPNKPDSQYCIKIINNPSTNENYKKYNSIKKEFELQSQLADINIDGVRLPTPYLVIENKKLHLIVMEKLEADPLYVFTNEQMVGKPHIKKTLPKDFDAETFFTALTAYMKEWHRQGFHHRDFHLGNIMLDRQTLMPLVIDTGRTKKIQPSEDPYNETVVNQFSTTKNYFPKDLEMLEKAKQTLKTISQSKNKE